MDPPPKKKRGPYKRWLTDPSVPIPPSTLHSRELASQRAAEGDSSALQLDENEPDPQMEHDQTTDKATTAVPHSDESSTSRTANKERARQDFIIKHHLSDKLHPDSHLSKLDVLLMILHMAVRHCHTQHFIEDQIKFVNSLYGSNVLDVSYYIFKTLFTPSITITKHYFCVDCKFYLGKDEDFLKPECPECQTTIWNSSNNFIICPDCCCCVGSVDEFDESESIQCHKCMKDVNVNSRVPDGGAVCLNCKCYLTSKHNYLKRVESCQCDKCKKQVNVKSLTSGNYFITFSLREQIEEFLSKPGLKFVSRNGRDKSVIADICDGEMYQKFMEGGGPLENENALTITFNTDGVAQENTDNHLYPIWYYINEVAPEQRFKQDNLLLGGIWYSKCAPDMSLFLQPFVTDIIDLAVNGVTRTLSNGSQVTCPVFPLMCSVDSVCKPKVVCQKQFNGKMGCLYCYHPNDTTVPNLKNQRFYGQDVVYMLRNDKDVVRDMMQADKFQQEGRLGTDSVNGILGISVLLKFTDLVDCYACNTFDIVWGMAIDYMHAALEGVGSDLCNIIANLLTPDQLSALNKNFRNITPPQAITRRPRSFSLRTYWKAKELRAVLLYYLVTCLDGVLADNYYQNLKLFVNALHIFLGDLITYAQLSEAASCLEKFGIGYQKLYGVVNLSYNLHVIRHFAEQVKKYGGLWCSRNFVFESGNGYLVRLVRGTKSVANEIAIKHTTIKSAANVITNNIVSDKAVQFCSEILKCSYPKQDDGESEMAPLLLSQSHGH